MSLLFSKTLKDSYILKMKEIRMLTLIQLLRDPTKK